MYNDFHTGKRAAVEEYERSWLNYMAKTHGTNVSDIARRGGIHRTTLYSMLRKYGYSRKVLERLHDPLA